MNNKNIDFIILAIGKIIQVAISILSIRILTEFLNPDEVGNYYLIITLLTLFNFVLLNPIGQYYGRQLIQWKLTRDISNATNLLLFLRLIAISLSLLILLIIYLAFGYFKSKNLEGFFLFFFISLIASTHGVLLNAINTLGYRIRFTIYNVMTLLCSLLISLVFIFFLDKSAMNWLYGIAVSQILFSIGLYNFITKHDSFSFEKVKSVFQKKFIKKVAIFIFPITITLLFQWGQNQAYRFIIELKYSLEILGYIGVGLGISSAIFSAVESIATQFYNPIYLKQITHANKKDREKAWNELASYMIPIYILLTVFIISLAPFITNILVAEKFYEAYIYCVYGAIIEFFRVITNLIYLVSQTEVKTKNTIVPYALGFLFTIGTLYFFDMTEKLWLISLCLSIAYFITFISLYFNMKKLLKIKISIYGNIKAIILSLPFFYTFYIINDKSILQAITLILGSGTYLLITSHLIIQKKIFI